MILERLREFRERDEVAAQIIPADHKEQGVRWILEVAEDGRFLGFTEVDQTLLAPYRMRQGSPTPPYLLVDKPDYVLGVDREGDRGERAEQRHEAYTELIRECADAIPDSRLEAYQAFLQDHIETARADPAIEQMNPGDLIAPRVGEAFPTELDAVQEFWQQRCEAQAVAQSGMEAGCLLCGHEKPIARTHPIELVVGGERVRLVSGNESAFLSYGLRQSEIAPLCHECAREYGEALRYLLQHEQHRLYMAGTVWLFWTREPSDFDIVGLLSGPDPDDVHRLLRAPVSGTYPNVDENAFYALSMSANQSRAVVRSWLETTVSEVEENLHQYFERQRIRNYSGDDSPLSIYALAGSTVRDFDDLSPRTLPQLLETAIRGHPLPKPLLRGAVRRAQADQDAKMTRPRAALIKLVLLSQPNGEEEFQVTDELNSNHPSPAYQCGRLLALLDDVQRNAVGARATLVDRYYGSASATPASVFGVLMRNTQSHLSKLRRSNDTYGLYRYFDREIGGVMAQLDGFPRTLSMEEQGLFALGFYQQKHRPRRSQSDDNATEEDVANVSE